MTRITPLETIANTGLFGNFVGKNKDKLIRISEISDVKIYQIVQYKISKLNTSLLQIDNQIFSTQPGSVSANSATRIQWNGPKVWTVISNNKNITNGGSVTGTGFYGPLEGLVYGIDVRELAGSAAPGAFDFGNLNPTFVNLLDFLSKETDLEFGKFVNPGVSAATVELGTLASV